MVRRFQGKRLPSPAVLRALLRELTTFRRAPRIPEPDLVMDDAAKVAAYTQAGREDGVMAPVYLFNTRHACDVIRPGDVVLDLACGPATQLAQIARYNPESTFIGIDLSEPMLERAAAFKLLPKLLSTDLPGRAFRLHAGFAG